MNRKCDIGMWNTRKWKRIIWLLFVLLLAAAVWFIWSISNGKDKKAEMIEEKLHLDRIDDFDKMAEQVVVKKNITYSTKYSNSELDVYMPKENFGMPKPTIFWAHGGAFIAGDKKSVADYSTMLASQGYVVVNMNYSLAPDYEYPVPILQVGDAYLYIAANKEYFDVDLERIAFGGDSAGGQIIGQFVNVQVDSDYADKIDIKPVIKEPESIKSVIFFSALLDINQYDENENEKANAIFHQSAQAYFGLENWKGSDIVNGANIIDNVNGSYPPVYITDGNTVSFQAHAEELIEQLENEQVPVTSTFFPVEEAELRHQYQFRFSLPQSVENYEALSTFLDTYLKKQEKTTS